MQGSGPFCVACHVKRIRFLKKFVSISRVNINYMYQDDYTSAST